MSKKAYFELSKGVALERYKIVKNLCDIVSYSSKTNPDVTPILEKNTDCQFTVHTEYELKHIKDFKRVFFLAQGWSKKLIKDLLEKGITKFGVDNETDLDVLIGFLRGRNEKVELILRVKLKEHSIRTEKYFVFGMNADVVNKRIKELKDNKNISSLGIHFHRKTQNIAEWDLKYELSSFLTKETIAIIDTLNIGGGLPSIYANTNVKVFDSIYKKILELKSWLNENEIKLVIEPGRFIAAPCVKLITYITGIHDNNLIINASVYNCDTDAFVVPTRLLIENEVEKDEGEAYIIKGCTPCSMDLFRYRVYFKNKPKVEDKIVFINAGAYNFASDFCDLEKLETKIVD